MIAHIRQPKERQSAAPIIRARHMVAETLFPDEPPKLRRWTLLRKASLLGSLVLLAGMAVLACYFWR